MKASSSTDQTAPALRPGRGQAAGSARTAAKASAGAKVPGPRQTGMGLHTADGLRKYLTAGERDAFLREAERADRAVRTLCMTLAYAGWGLSEALALTADRGDLAAGVLTFESLKKRRTGIYRSIPVPPALLDALDLVQGIRERQAGRGRGRGVLLWPWSRMTGWRAVHEVMASARLKGPPCLAQGPTTRLWRGGRLRRDCPADVGIEVSSEGWKLRPGMQLRIRLVGN